MLGTLAKWLRILGFDVYYADKVISDGSILEIAKKERRKIITMDKQLKESAKRRGIDVVDVENEDLDNQIRTVLSMYPIEEHKILSRCTICNTPLVEIEKDRVAGRVPDKVLRYHDKFWYCKKCDKIYWKGSHWDKMKERINRIKENI